MVQQGKPGTVQLSDQDQERMARLTEEIFGRVEEMALVTSRALSLNSEEYAELADYAELVFRRRKQLSEQRKVPPTIELTHPSGKSGCYDYFKSVCYACGDPNGT